MDTINTCLWKAMSEYMSIYENAHMYPQALQSLRLSFTNTHLLPTWHLQYDHTDDWLYVSGYDQNSSLPNKST